MASKRSERGFGVGPDGTFQGQGRHKLGRDQSERSFTKHASKTHARNLTNNRTTLGGTMMRGGIRL